ncbi:MAG: hypothetical protein QOH35_2304, partial [Acidobacteriaceae bacterium]|nr:hypothetical protein [Acidobacteriaceae bacterium]
MILRFLIVRYPKVCTRGLFTRFLGRLILFLLRHCDWFPNIAVIPDTKQGRPFSEVLSPFAQA